MRRARLRARRPARSCSSARWRRQRRLLPPTSTDRRRPSPPPAGWEPRVVRRSPDARCSRPTTRGTLRSTGRRCTRAATRSSPRSSPTVATSSTPTSARTRTTASPTSSCRATEPRLPITYDAYGDESDPGPFPIPQDAPVEGGAGATGDRHVIAVQQGTCELFELFAARPSGSGLDRRRPAPDSTCVPTRCARSAGRAPTPPGCRSSPASSATTRWRRARSATRSGSR